MLKIIRCFCVFVTAPHSCGAFVLQIAGQAGNDVIPDLIGDRYNQKDKNIKEYELFIYIRISIGRTS